MYARTVPTTAPTIVQTAIQSHDFTFSAAGNVAGFGFEVIQVVLAVNAINVR